jgi:hypothetical protein
MYANEVSFIRVHWCAFAVRKVVAREEIIRNCRVGESPGFCVSEPLQTLEPPPTQSNYFKNWSTLAEVTTSTPVSTTAGTVLPSVRSFNISTLLTPMA